MEETAPIPKTEAFNAPTTDPPRVTAACFDEAVHYLYLRQLARFPAEMGLLVSILGCVVASRCRGLHKPLVLSSLPTI